MRRIALVVLAGLAGIAFGGVIIAAPASAITVTTWSDLQTAMAAGGTVTLGADIVPPDVPAGAGLELNNATATLDLNGHRLTIPNPPTDVPAIHVGPAASLTIEDTVGTGLLTVTGGPGGESAIGGSFLGSNSETNGFIAFAAGSHTVVNAGAGGFTVGPSGVDANSLWTNAGTLTLNGLTPMDGQSNDGLVNASTGVIYLNGTMSGAGTLTNNGVIVVGPSPDGITTGYTWIGNYYAISYNANYAGGTNPASQTVYGPTLASTTQSLPAAPTRVGYSSLGWFTAASGGSAVTNSSMLASLYSPVQNNPTLYLHWTLITEAVTFDSRGGSAVATEHVDYGSSATVPAAPKRSGYTFTGWSPSTTGKPLWNFSSQITAPLTLYGVWKAIPVPAAGGGATHSATPSSSAPVNLAPPLAPPSRAVPSPTPSPAPTSSSPPATTPTPSSSPSSASAASPSLGAPRGGSSGGTLASGSDRRTSGWTTPSSLSHSIPSIYKVLSHPERLGLALSLGFVWTLLLLLATSSLDNVISSNYDSWLTRAGKKFPRLRRAASKIFGHGHDRTWIAMIAVFVVDAIVLDFVDPHFRPSETSARLLMSSMTAVFVETLVPCLVIIRVARQRYKTAGRLRATPFGLVIGAAGVLVSRLLGFLPGLLGGSTMTYDEPQYKEAERVWLARLKVILVLGIAGLCWAALSAIPPHRSLLELFFHDAAVIGATAAITSTVLDLVPFAVFGGSLLFHRARRSWAALMLVSSVAFFLLVVPQPSYWLYVGPRVMWWVVVATIVIFTAITLLAILQWKHRHADEDEAKKSDAKRPAKSVSGREAAAE